MAKPGLLWFPAWSVVIMAADDKRPSGGWVSDDRLGFFITKMTFTVDIHNSL